MAIGDVTGSVPDVISGALALSDAMTPDKGFGYSLYYFSMNLQKPEESQAEQTQPTSTNGNSSSNTSSKPNGTTATTAKPSQTQVTNQRLVARDGPVIFKVLSGTNTEGPQTVVELGIKELSNDNQIIGVVELRKLEGFDTSLFDNLAIEVNGTQAGPSEILLIIKGLINPTGIGFAHFIGGVSISLSNLGGGNASLRSQAVFITQAPPSGAGRGLFGKNIRTYAFGSHLQLQMSFEPLGR